MDLRSCSRVIGRHRPVELGWNSLRQMHLVRLRAVEDAAVGIAYDPWVSLPYTRCFGSHQLTRSAREEEKSNPCVMVHMAVGDEAGTSPHEGLGIFAIR